jgi:hypothetical protein
MSPTNRPSVHEMLLQLEQAYQQLLAQQPTSDADAQRLPTVLADFSNGRCKLKIVPRRG